MLKFDLHLVAVDPDHGWAQILADAGQDLGVIVVGDGLDHGVGPLLGVVTFENERKFRILSALKIIEKGPNKKAYTAERLT